MSWNTNASCRHEEGLKPGSIPIASVVDDMCPVEVRVLGLAQESENVKRKTRERSRYRPGPTCSGGKPLTKHPGMRVQDGNWFTYTPKWPTVILCGQPKQKHSGKSSSAQPGWRTPKPCQWI